MKLSHRQTMDVIEEYRKAFWAHRDPAKKVSPFVSHDHIAIANACSAHSVCLYDSWIEIRKPGHCLIAKPLVEGSNFSGPTLENALEKLLNFVRGFFIDDSLFRKI